MTVTRESFLSAITRHAPASRCARILLVVEGVNDIEFLRRISSLLHSHDASLPALAELEQRGELVFVPFGGGNVKAWTRRLAPLAMPEFHLYDRESPPETDQRREAAAAVNRRTRCRAALTRKRSLENYLHPRAIFAARGVDLTFEDFDPVAELAAQRVYELGVYQLGLNQTPWEQLPRARPSPSGEPGQTLAQHPGGRPHDGRTAAPARSPRRSHVLAQGDRRLAGGSA